MTFRKRSFFWRLLYAFLIGGLLPLILLAFVFGRISAEVLETAYRTRTSQVVSGAAEQVEKIIAEASKLATELAKSEAVLAWISSAEKDAWRVSEVNRLFSSLIVSSLFIPYIVPLDGDYPITRGGVPDEYFIDLYSGWGILGVLERNTPLEGQRVIYGQPHPDAAQTIPMAVGVCVYQAKTLLGYVIIDINRRMFIDRVGNPAASGGAVTELVLVSNTGCVIYNMTDSHLEADFLNVKPNDNKFLSKTEILDDFVLYGLYPAQAVRVYSEKIIRTALFITLGSVIIFLIMAVLFSKSIAKPVHALSLTMEKVAQGQLDARCIIPPKKRRQDEIAYLVQRFNATLDQVNSLIDNLIAQERDLRRAEMQALQAQMNPHFLYNSLNSIRSMAKLSGSMEIAAMTTSLARILREGSLPGASFTTVKDSLSIARDYFLIESMRWPGRFFLEEKIEEAALEAKIPRLILQPIIENALVHGLELKKGRGVVSIEVIIAAGDLLMIIRDNGVGIEPAALNQLTSRLNEASAQPVESSLHDLSLPSLSQSAGIALVNTHRRLCLMFGNPYGLNIKSSQGEGTVVTVAFPFQKTEATICSR